MAKYIEIQKSGYGNWETTQHATRQRYGFPDPPELPMVIYNYG